MTPASSACCKASGQAPGADAPAHRSVRAGWFTQDWRVERKLTEDAEVIEQEVMAEVAGDVARAIAQRGHGLSFNGRLPPPVKVSVSSRNDADPAAIRARAFAPQVPFMCDSVGLRLLALKRIRIGRVALAQLPPGQWRYMLADERF